MKDERMLEVWVEGTCNSSDMFSLGRILTKGDVDWTMIWKDYSEKEVKESFLSAVYHLLCGIHTMIAIGMGDRYEDRVDTETMNSFLDGLRIRVTDSATMNRASSTLHPEPHLFVSPHGYEVC